MQVESGEGEEGGKIQCVIVTQTNMRLMTHMVQSMPCGMVHGWTMLTVNWASVSLCDAKAPANLLHKVQWLT